MSDFWSNLLFSVYIYTIASTILFLILENRNPVKSMAWILVLVTIPYLGFVLYILFGRKFRKKKTIERRSLKNEQNTDSSTSLKVNGTYSVIEKMLGQVGIPDPVVGNKVDMYVTGKSLIEQLITDLENAERCIYIEYYIFNPDNTGKRIAEILQQKALEGLKIKMIVDDVGSWKLRGEVLSNLKKSGVKVERFLPVIFPYLDSQINYRNHRKIVIIDDRIGYTGGMNIADRYVEGLKWGEWRDTHLRIEGEAALSLRSVFVDDWYFVCRERLADIESEKKDITERGKIVQIVKSGPDMKYRTIEQMYQMLITHAQRYIYIETPYFMPSEVIKGALITAAQSGTDVRIIIPLRSDEKFILKSSYSYVDELTEAGVKIYFYKFGFIHSKVFVADDEVVSCGSANLDFRSLEHNFEVNALIYDAEEAVRFRGMFENDLEKSDLMDIARWRSRPRMMKLQESLARLLAPIF